MAYRLKTLTGEYTLTDTDRNRRLLELLDELSAPGVVIIDTQQGTVRVNLSESVAFALYGDDFSPYQQSHSVTVY